MSSVWSSALAPLDDSSALLCEGWEKLKAAKSVDIAEVIEQVKTAAESAQELRTLVLSELPEASWQNREELDALLEKIQERVEARTLEQLRSRLLALATEMERGSIVHRRTLRVSQLDELGDQAINELRSQARLEGGALQTLPGPEADEWIEWACGLQEPEDTESLQTLRNGFARLDDFVANLEPSMWVAAGSPTSEIPPKPEGSPTETRQEPSPLETSGLEEPVLSSGPIQIGLRAAKSSAGRDELRSPPSLDELSQLELDSNTLTPDDVIPAQTEEEIEQIQTRERALLASMMGLVSDPVRHFNHPVEAPFTAEALSAAPAIAKYPVEASSTAEAFREASAAPAITSDIRIEVEEPRRAKWRMLLATVAVLVLAVMGALLWRSRRIGLSNGPAKAIERRIPDLAVSNPENNGSDQSGMSTVSETHTSLTKPQDEKQSKPKDQSVAPGPISRAVPAKPASKIDNAAPRSPVTISKNVAIAKKEEAPPKGATEVPGSVPGGLPTGVANSAIKLIRDIPVAEAKLTAPPVPQPKSPAQKVRVSSGVAQGLLLHQVTPQYPPMARQLGIQGTVVLQAVIGKDGTVQNVHALSSHPMLTQAAVDAVKQWRYKPYYLNGEPVEADTQITVNFTLP